MKKKEERQAKEEAQTSGSLSFDFSMLNSQAEDILKASMQPEATSVNSYETPTSGVKETEDKLLFNH